MTKFVRIFVITLLSLSILTLSIGYASVADEFFISGDTKVEGKPFEGVYIADAGVYYENLAKNVSFSFYNPTNFTATADPTVVGGSITYRITLHNNTDVTYWFVKQEFYPEYESNSLIGQTDGITIVTKDHPDDLTETFNSDDWIPPQTFRDIYVTYTFGKNAQADPTTLVNFLFGVKMDSVQDSFLAVLNDTSFGGSYEYLCQQFDKKYAETGETVLTNVGSETEIFDTLFGSKLTINIDGNEVPVTVTIRRDNVDNRATGDSYSGSGPSGCEYTIYLTVDALNSTSGKAEVYAVSYSKGGATGGDSWYQLGQLYEGTANVIDYSDEEGLQGAIDISTWEATPKKYVLANGITYLVGQEQGDQYDKLKTLEQIMSTNDQDIFNDIDNSHILKTVYDIVHNSKNANKDGINDLKKVFENASNFYNVYNNGQEVKVKRNCTRAEIIPHIVAIQQALDYYNQVN